MRTPTYLSMSLFIVTLASAPAWAHDENLHHGTPTTGEVTMVSGDHITLKTTDGDVAVTVAESTRIEQHGTVVDRTALQPGAHVAVLGTKLPTGELVAKEVHVEENAGNHAAAYE